MGPRERNDAFPGEEIVSSLNQERVQFTLYIVIKGSWQRVVLQKRDGWWTMDVWDY